MSEQLLTAYAPSIQIGDLGIMAPDPFDDDLLQECDEITLLNGRLIAGFTNSRGYTDSLPFDSQHFDTRHLERVWHYCDYALDGTDQHPESGNCLFDLGAVWSAMANVMRDAGLME